MSVKTLQEQLEKKAKKDLTDAVDAALRPVYNLCPLYDIIVPVRIPVASATEKNGAYEGKMSAQEIMEVLGAALKEQRLEAQVNATVIEFMDKVQNATDAIEELHHYQN